LEKSAGQCYFKIILTHGLSNVEYGMQGDTRWNVNEQSGKGASRLSEMKLTEGSGDIF
jgi:hypothetical protein